MMKTYERYKPSGIEWLGDIPEHWHVKRIKYLLITKITDGPHETPVFLSEGIPFLSVDSIQDGELRFKDCRYISVDDHKKYQRKCIVEKGDILMGKAASIGKIAQVKVDFEFSIWSPLALIKPNREVINGTFFEYVLKTPSAQDQIEILCTSNTQKNISMDDIPKLISVLPPLEEQTAIVGYLDEKTAQLDKLTEGKRRLITLLKEERAAVINKAVTRGINPQAQLKPSGVDWLGEIPEHWESKRITSISTKITNGYVGPTRDILVNEGVRYLQSLHIKNNRILFEHKYFVREEWSRQHSKSILKEDDLLIVQTGDIGQVARVPKEFEGVNCHALIIVSPKHDQINGKFLALFMNSNYGFHSLKAVQTGALHPHLNCGNIREIFVTVPPLGEQKQIVQFIEAETDKIDATAAKIEKEIEYLLEYRTALISEVVTGKIKVV